MGKNRYADIVDVLTAELAELEPGTRVASEYEIASRFGVSRATARAAVQELEGRLLVRRVRGSGTYTSRRIDYVISSRRAPSWHQTVIDAGGTPRSVVRDLRSEPLPEAFAARLERSAGSLANLLVRQYYVDGLLTTWTNEWIPADVLPEVDIDTAIRTVESIDLILRQVARSKPVRAWCRVSLGLPNAEVAAGLEAEPGRQVWLVESLSRDAHTGQALMCSNAWSRPDTVRIAVEMDEPWTS